METPKFSLTMDFARFCKVTGLDGINFIPYTVKTGTRTGQAGYFCKVIDPKDNEIILSVSSKLVPMLKAKTVTKEMLQISRVAWPDGTNGTIIHPAGEDATYLSAS